MKTTVIFVFGIVITTASMAFLAGELCGLQNTNAERLDKLQVAFHQESYQTSLLKRRVEALETASETNSPSASLRLRGENKGGSK